MPRERIERIDSLPLILYWLLQMQVDKIIEVSQHRPCALAQDKVLFRPVHRWSQISFLQKLGY